MINSSTRPQLSNLRKWMISSQETDSNIQAIKVSKLRKLRTSLEHKHMSRVNSIKSNSKTSIKARTIKMILVVNPNHLELLPMNQVQ